MAVTDRRSRTSAGRRPSRAQGQLDSPAASPEVEFTFEDTTTLVSAEDGVTIFETD